jgi:diguanylate cyclase (GGDEF)-like protein
VSALAFLLVDLVADMARTSEQSLVGTAAAVGYPFNAACVLAVLLAVLPRAEQELRSYLRIAGAGVALLALGDVGYSVGALHGWYTPTTWPAMAMQGGLVLLALSPLRARRALSLTEHSPCTPGLVEAAAPYIAVAPGIALSLLMIGRGQRFSLGQMGASVLVGAALIGRQLLSNAEQRRAITGLRQREREATAQALRDPLTLLGNRTALHDRLNALLRDPQKPPVALALLDLDDFKDVNDTHGHETGDAVLREVACRLLGAAPPGSLVARHGGDEFGVCSTGAAAEDLAAALLHAFDDAVPVGTRRFSVTASIGAVMADAGEASAAVALSHVDVAMYQAKSRKEPQQSGVVVLTGQARAQAAARVQLRDDASRPDLMQFRVVYEPVVDLADGSVVGAEALLRWHHPLLGEVPPDEFIPLAEQVGAIGELGEFALRRATSDLAGWHAMAERLGAPLERGSVGVNLSPRQLGSPGLVELVRDVLAESGLAPHRLVLEITEEALLDDWDTAVDVVRRLRALGVGVAVDDFGTGYSSLRYLRRFDTSTVKVDREFVQAVADEPRTRALVASVLDMASSLDLYTVAEGIETLDQLQVLRTLGCRFAQGHLFDRPLEPDAFGALLLGRHRYPMGPAALHVPAARVPAGARSVVPSSVPVVPRRGGVRQPPGQLRRASGQCLPLGVGQCASH